MLGLLGEANQSYRAALAILEAEKVDSEGEAQALPWAVQRERGDIIFELAVLSLREQDTAQARGLLGPLLEADDADPYFIDRLRARADLEPLWDIVSDEAAGL